MSATQVLGLLATEPSPRVRVALARLLEWLLLLERLEEAPDREERLALLAASGRRGAGNETGAGTSPREKTVTLEAGPDQEAKPGTDAKPGTNAFPVPRREGRRPRAPTPLWSPEASEEREVLARVRSVLEWANREFGASFEVERSSRDVLRYPYPVVRGALANVLLKRARGYRFENPGAVLWDGITLPHYKLEEFSVARLEEVLRLCRESEESRSGPEPPRDPEKPPEGRPQARRPETRRQDARNQVYRSLGASVRDALDARAQRAALEKTPRSEGGSEALREGFRALRVHEERELLLEREHGAAIEALLRAARPAT